MSMTALELYHALGDLIAKEPKYVQYEVVLEGCDCFRSMLDINTGYEGVLILSSASEYDQPLRLTPETAKILEEEQAKVQAALDKRLLDNIKPEFKDLLP